MAGRISYYGGIVTNGLILDLDAAKRDSYPGSGTTWNDISGNRNNGTLINGPTFDADNGGSIVFDGVDDYTNLGDVLDLGTNNLTINAWINLSPSPNTDMYIFSKSLFGAQSYRYGFSVSQTKLLTFFQGNGGSDVIPRGITVLSTNTWYMVTTVINRSSNILMYINGVQESFTGSNTVSQWNNLNFQSTNPSRVGSYTTSNNTGANLFFKGKIASLQVYFKALSATEILQNFNATKGRYGL